MQLINSELGASVSDVRVLDAACGIGTPALPLAARGFQLTARDISAAAVARLQREAEIRKIVDVVLAFDNSLAHLLDDNDLSLDSAVQKRPSARAACFCARSVITTKCNAGWRQHTCTVAANMAAKHFS